MAITKTSKATQNQVWSGLAADTKPLPPTDSVGIGALFYETDTGKKFEFRGTAIGWVAI